MRARLCMLNERQRSPNVDPLQPVAMPTQAVLISLTEENCWLTEGASLVYLAYVATNSTQAASFVSLQGAANGVEVRSLAGRRSYSPDYQYGVVLVLSLADKLETGQSVHVMLAQSGATTYYPPQPIQD